MSGGANRYPLRVIIFFMKLVHFVRHAEYENPLGVLPGRLPMPLSEHGRTQADKLKQYFASRKIDRIYSSAVLRCRQTSQIIANGKIPIQFDPRLLETFSAYQGFKPLAEGEWQEYAHVDELGGETLSDQQARMVSFFEELKSKNFQEVIVCSHGDPLYTLFLHIKNHPLPANHAELMNQPGFEYQNKATVRTLRIDADTHGFDSIVSFVR